MAQADAGNADLTQDASGQMVTADGVPLKLSLKRAERQRKLMALALVLPLLLFLLVVFIFPIGQMMWRSVDNPQVVNALPQTLEALQGWDGEELPGEEVYAALAADFRRDMERPRRDQFSGPLGVRLNYELSAARGAVARTVRKVPDFEPPYKEAFLDSHRLWGDVALWRVIEREGRPLTSAYYVAALDRQFNDEGEIELRDENRRIYTDLYIRTLGLSITITVLTILLGFPIAYYMSILPMRYSNLLMIFVLLPFWTSLLVRTTAWIVLLQQQGVINESLIAVGIIGEDGRFSLMYNMFGTIIAMTHILLPFMVLPLYSVMRTIPPSYMRAAKSPRGHAIHGVPQGLSAPDAAGNRCRRGARLHHLDRLLHHPRPRRRPVGPDDLERDCATHAAITELGPRGRTRDDSAARRSGALLGL